MSESTSSSLVDATDSALAEDGCPALIIGLGVAAKFADVDRTTLFRAYNSGRLLTTRRGGPRGVHVILRSNLARYLCLGGASGVMNWSA